MMLRSNFGRLIILALVHFTVDFYAGMLIPLPEPTLTRHLGLNLASVALLLGGTAIIVNLVQPLSGWILPKRGLPILLLLGPCAAAVIACIGLTHSVFLVAAMLVVGSIGIGIVHPEGALAAHSLAGSRKGLGVSIFLSGGYFGFALGSLVSGWWAESHSHDLARLWVLTLPALVVVALVLLSGLHRLQGHAEEDTSPQVGMLPFTLVLALAVSIALTVSIVVRFATIFLVRSFPDQRPQAWGGATVAAMGVSGALAASLWGHLSDRFGSARLIFVMQLLCAPFLYLFLHVKSPSYAPVWAIGFGATIGAVCPLCIVLARQSRGLAQRLRMGLAIGGAWCTGEVAFILGGKYVALFPDDAVRPVAAVLNLCWVFLGAAVVLSAIVARREKAAIAATQAAGPSDPATALAGSVDGK